MNVQELKDRIELLDARIVQAKLDILDKYPIAPIVNGTCPGPIAYNLKSWDAMNMRDYVPILNATCTYRDR